MLLFIKFTSLIFRWRESTLTLPYQCCKTAWPVSQLESFFLPEFPVKDLHKDNNYEKLPQISRGAFGKIYRILDLEKNEIFALKVLSKSKVSTRVTFNPFTWFIFQFPQFLWWIFLSQVID